MLLEIFDRARKSDGRIGLFFPEAIYKQTQVKPGCYGLILKIYKQFIKFHRFLLFQNYYHLCAGLEAHLIC